MNTSLSLRLPAELLKALEVLAKATDRPKSYLIRKALEGYLLEYADDQLALDRLRNPEDRVLSSAELRKHLGL